MISRFSRRFAAIPTRSVTRRWMGSGGHGHGHEAEVVARPFGMVPGAAKEGWEIPTYLTYIGMTAMLFYGGFIADNETPLDWARREAQARERVTANGGEVLFGKYYQYIEYETDEDGNVKAKSTAHRSD